MAAESTSNRHGRGGKHSTRSSPTQSGGQRKSKPAEHSEPIAEHVGEQLKQVSESVSSGVNELRHRVREATHGREGTVVVTAFAVGIGFGVVLGAALAMPRRQPTWRDRLMADSVSQRVLHRLEELLPRGLANRIRS